MPHVLDLDLKQENIIALRNKYKEIESKIAKANMENNKQAVLLYKQQLKGMRRSLGMLDIEFFWN